MNIGAKMRAARIQAGLDVNQLAALVGTTAERIEGLETGRNIVNAKILLMVAKHLSVSPVYFFIRDDENHREDEKDQSQSSKPSGVENLFTQLEDALLDIAFSDASLRQVQRLTIFLILNLIPEYFKSKPT